MVSVLPSALHTHSLPPTTPPQRQRRVAFIGHGLRAGQVPDRRMRRLLPGIVHVKRRSLFRISQQIDCDDVGSRLWRQLANRFRRCSIQHGDARVSAGRQHLFSVRSERQGKRFQQESAILARLLPCRRVIPAKHGVVARGNQQLSVGTDRAGDSCRRTQTAGSRVELGVSAMSHTWPGLSTGPTAILPPFGKEIKRVDAARACFPSLRRRRALARQKSPLCRLQIPPPANCRPANRPSCWRAARR